MMTTTAQQQLGLFEPSPAPLARRLDPETSHKAAQRAMSFKSHHEAAIVNFLKAAGGSAICETIAVGTGLDEVAVCRRMASLMRAGKVKPDGTGPNRRGNQCTKWLAL